MADRNSFARALEAVRNTEPGQAPQWAVNTINAAIGSLWARIKGSPDAYVMNDNEFSLFNYFRSRYSHGSDDVIAKRAITRYWNQRNVANGR